MNKWPAASLSAALLATTAQAGPLDFFVSQTGSPHTTVIDFDKPLPPGITVNFFNDKGGIVQGTVVGSHVAPIFGGVLTTGKYGSTYAGDANIVFPGPQKNLEIGWGTPDGSPQDPYQWLDLYQGVTLIGTVQGWRVRNACETTFHTAECFVHVISDTPFGHLRLHSEFPSFEFYKPATDPAGQQFIPEPVSLAVLSVGLAGFGMVRRQVRASLEKAARLAKRREARAQRQSASG
jgi:hypothetical protein